MSYANRAYDSEAIENGKKKNGLTGDDIDIMFQDNTSRKSLCIKVIVFLLLAALVAVVVLAVLLAIERDKDSSDGQDSQGQTCMSSDCVLAAANLLSKMDQTADPCEDFYQFSCGSWIEENVIPEDKSAINTFTLLDDKVANALKGLLEQESEADEKDFIKKAKNLYSSCMDLKTLNAKGATPLVILVQSTFQGWPIANQSWDESQFNLQDGILKVFALNSAAFFNVYVFTDAKNSTKRIFHIDQPGFVLPGREYYLKPRNDSILEAYEDRIAATAQLMLGDAVTVDRDQARDQAREIVDFEIELAKISVPSEERRDGDSLYNPTNLTDLQRDYGQIFHWKSLMGELFGVDGVVDSIADDEVIINVAPSFFSNLTELLNKTSNRVKANYMIWQIVSPMSKCLSEDFLDMIHDYDKVVYGTQVMQPRSLTCILLATDNLGLAVGRLFIEDNFNPESKAEMVVMIDNLQAAFNDIVDDLQWMDASTKQVAKEKNQYIHRAIGYPDKVTNDTAMSILYENYTYSADALFSNVEGAKRESFKENLRSLRRPVDTKAWNVPPSTVNAYYSPSKNQVMFPAGILQPPVYSLTNPRSVNYGGIGMFIGHEITHGFDDQGRQYDKNGNFIQWWDDAAIDNFENRTQCLVDQYGRFFYEEANMTVNGINTLGENIADNGGLKESFKAYRSWVATQGKEEDKLPGLDLTHDQLFFVGFAQLWCDKSRKESAVKRILTGVHSPKRFRVIGTLQNSQEFSNAYQCRQGSFMNAAKKCSVW